MIDSSVYMDCLCQDCKDNIAEKTSKLSLKDQLRPKRVAKKSVLWICDDCKRRITDKMLEEVHNSKR